MLVGTVLFWFWYPPYRYIGTKMPFGNFEQEKMSIFSESIFFESTKRAPLLILSERTSPSCALSFGQERERELRS